MPKLKQAEHYMYEILSESRFDPHPIVTLDHERHEDMTEVVRALREGYEPSTWENYGREAEYVLNRFFAVAPGTRKPIIWIDRIAGAKLVRNACEAAGAEIKRKSEPGAGYRVIFATRTTAVQVDTQLNLARKMTDIAADLRFATDGNCFVRAGYDPEMHRRAQRRVTGDDVKARPVRDTGRYFAVPIPGRAAPVVDDPRLHDRIDSAFRRYGTNVCVYHGWRTKEDVRCRGDEAFGMTFRSLFEGARAAGEHHFGRVLLLKDKPTGPVLTKLGAFTQDYAHVFYQNYIDGDRRAFDPRGWGRAEYEKACWAGDEEALDTPIFYTLDRTRLSADTARYMFSKVVRRAGIRCGNRPAWMHLGRHDATNRSLDAIEGLDVPEGLKERLRYDLADYMGWASADKMLAWYGARHLAMRDARRVVAFQDRHGGDGFLGALPADPKGPDDDDDDDDALSALFDR